MGVPVVRRALLAVLALALVACPPAPVDAPVTGALMDAGDEAFVRRVLPLLWGRRARSANEVGLLTQVAEDLGRAELIRAMANSEEYVDHQSQWLLDAMHVNRIDDRANQDCYGWRRLPNVGPDLAAFVRDNRPEDAVWPDQFTMLDLLDSALQLDDLSVPYRANLFAQISEERLPMNVDDDRDLRANIAGVTMATYLHRSPDCMSCHNSEFSVTGHTDPELDRTWEVPGLFEKALFGDSGGGDIERLAVYHRRIDVLYGFTYEGMNGLVDGCSARPGEPGCDFCLCEEWVCNERPSCCTDEWDEQCSNLCRGNMEVAPDGNSCQPGLPPDFDGCSPAVNNPGCGGCACEEIVCEQNQLCCERGWHQGCVDMCTMAGFCVAPPEPDPATLPGASPWGITLACGRFFTDKEMQDDLMEQDGFFIEHDGVDASIWDLEERFGDGVELLRTDGLTVGSDQTVQGEMAFAWLWSMNMADQVWERAFGERLTISNYFPRNQAQRDALRPLAERFASTGYSLVELLVAVLTHPYYNQVAPASGPEEGPYAMDPILDPWVVDDQEDPNLRMNSVGDAIFRLPPRVLVRSGSAALGWPNLTEFPQGSPSAEYRVQEDMGVFLKDSLKGFSGTDVQFLAAWEALYADCDGMIPAPEQNPPGFMFWSALADLLQGEPDPPTWGQLAAMLKDRLLADPNLDDPEERALVAELLGRDLDAVPQGGEIQQIQSILQPFCTALLSSPDFLLTGMEVPKGRAAPQWVVPRSTRAALCPELEAAMDVDLPGCP